MPPHAIVSSRQHHRIYWNQQLLTSTKLIHYYNTFITPEFHDFSIRNVTRIALSRILRTIHTLAIFEDVNHLITKERMFAHTDDYTVIFSCLHCFDVEQSLHPELTFIYMRGDHHLTLPKAILYHLLEMKALWCSFCGVMNFNWYTQMDCIECNYL